MPETRPTPSRLAADALPSARWLVPIAVGLAIASLGDLDSQLSLAFFAAAVALLLLAAIIFVVALGASPLMRVRDRVLSEALSADPDPVLVIDGSGCLIWANPAARRHFGNNIRDGLPATLKFAVADPQSLVADLTARALADGTAAERISMVDAVLDLRATDCGGDRISWRFARATAQPAASGVLRCRLDTQGRISTIGEALAGRTGAEAEVDRLDDIWVGSTMDGAVGSLIGTEGQVPAVMALAPYPDGSREAIFVPLHDPLDHRDFDQFPVPLLDLARNGRIRASNRLARQLLSFTEGEETALQDLVSGLGRPVRDWLTDAFAGRALQRPEVGHAQRAEGDLYVQITLDQVGAGEEMRMMAVLHDATEMKTLEAQFVQSQKMQAIGQLAGGIAHDFNNLLTAISGHCDLLLLRHDPGDQDFADLEQINQNANRAASLVGQLLAFSRKQNMRPERVDLRDILADLMHLLNRLVGERIDLQFDHDPELSDIRADKRQIEQVIMNLVVNARDAMPSGGRIQVSTRRRYFERLLHRDRAKVPPGDYVEVRVVDEGQGIPDDVLQKIFEPFFTTKRASEGTGLGLSTAYGIVKQSGGYIFCDSTPGKGTTFSLLFPGIEPETPAAAAPRLEKKKEEICGNEEGLILLAEDEPPVRAFAARALRMRGYTVMEAGSAEEALEILEDREIQPILFVSDVIMPGRDGPSWVSEALQSRPDTPVIFMSGYAEESFAENQRRIKNSVLLPKPFSLADLIRTVREHLQER